MLRFTEQINTKIQHNAEIFSHIRFPIVSENLAVAHFASSSVIIDDIVCEVIKQLYSTSNIILNQFLFIDFIALLSFGELAETSELFKISVNFFLSSFVCFPVRIVLISFATVSEFSI